MPHVVCAQLLYFTITRLQQYEELLDRVLQLVALLDDDMTDALRALDLTRSRAHLLWELGQRGPVTQQVLASALKVTPRAVTGLVDALVSSNLVTREPHPADRRATLVTLTPKGKALTDQLRRDHETLAQALFARMPRRELDGFSDTLAGVIVRLRRHLEDTTAGGARTSKQRRW